MRLVIDTSVLIAGTRSHRGRSNALLVAALRRRFTLIAAVPLMLEYEAVLMRREQLTASGLTEAHMGALLDALAAVAEPVMLRFLWRPQLPDPDDDMILEAAVNGRADAIATFNRRHFVGASERLGVAIKTPAESLTDMEHDAEE